MVNHKALKHVKKGMFAFFSAWIILYLYNSWEVTSWLDEMNSIFLTMLIIIVPLILLTELLFFLYCFLKEKIQDSFR